MSLIPDVPIPHDLSRRYSHTPAGRAWLASLPGLIGQLLDQWDLEPDLEPGALPWNGHGGVVIPVRRRDVDGSPGNGGEAVLKVAFPHEEATREHHALALWGGHGAVRLLAADAGSCALLLERLDACRSLLDVPLDTAVTVWGGVVRQLSVVPDSRPEWLEIDHVAARAERWSDEFPEAWEHLGRPFPRWLLEAALEVCQTRGAVGRRSGRDVLVHADLHYLNILARQETPAGPEAGTRKETPAGPGPYAAIDPQPMIGEAEFAVAPVLWNRIRELPQQDPGRALLARCGDFSAAAGLDAEAARQWSLAREVENALWYASQRHHDGDLARSLWVASTLAGRTLPGLPAPQELPAPGEAAGMAGG